MPTAVAVRPTPLRRHPNLSPARPGLVETVNEDLYDFQTYPAAGTNQLRFFNTPVGGTIGAGNPRTYADTNMQLSGQLPNGIQAEVRAIELFIIPGVLPALSGAPASGNAAFINDVWTIGKGGSYLVFNLLSKPYVTIAPLLRLPPSQRLSIDGMQSDTTTAAASGVNRSAYATWAGATQKITPVMITSNINFDVTIQWPTLIPTPSTQPLVLGMILRTQRYRVSQ